MWGRTGRGRDSWGVWKAHVHTAILKVDNQQRPPVPKMGLCSTLCGSLVGKGVWGRMDTWICTAKSLRCPPETIHNIDWLYPNTKKKVQATGPVKDTRVTEMLKRGSKHITYICCEVSYMCVSMYLYIERVVSRNLYNPVNMHQGWQDVH